MNIPSGNLMWPTYVNAASELFDSGRRDEAEDVLMHALRQAEELHQVDQRVVDSIHALAAWHCAHGDYARGESLYRRVLVLREQVLGPGHRDIADSMERVARLLRHTHRVMEAAALEFEARMLTLRSEQAFD